MLELRGVGFAYAAGDWVFRGVSLAVPAGTATAVLGPNGRGKTTLVRCAGGMLPPSEGTVHRVGRVGFVPQARGSAFAYSVHEMVLMGRVGRIGVFAVPGRRDHLAASSALERVGMSHLASRAFPSLSGGEQQLVLIARAVASGSPNLVLDEPVTGLDLGNQGQILVLLRSLVAEGMAVLYTTHHPDHALFVSDSVVLMRATEVLCGPAADLLTDQGLSTLYGVEVTSVPTASGDGSRGRAIVVRYDQGDENRVSPGPARDPSAPVRR